MIRLTFLPTWVSDALPEVGIVLNYPDLKFTRIVNSDNRYRDLIIHPCPNGASVFRNWEIFRHQRKFQTDFLCLYLVTVGQCPRCGEVFYDILSCDPQELSESKV